jgi:hypothetical protein
MATPAEGTWIPCSEKLPQVSQYVLYSTAQYAALGKRERETWWRAAASLEPEENPVLYWRPVSN